MKPDTGVHQCYFPPTSPGSSTIPVMVIAMLPELDGAGASIATGSDASISAEVPRWSDVPPSRIIARSEACLIDNYTLTCLNAIIQGRTMRKLVFFNIARMEKYQGLAQDKAVGGGSYPQQHGFGAEIFNFQHFHNTMYGFVEPGWTTVLKLINITKLGAHRMEQSVSGILVIWVARHPQKKTLVVGWYEDAKIYRKRQPPPPNLSRKQPDGRDAPYCVEADRKDCLLIPHSARDFQIFRAAELKAAGIAPQELKRPGGIGQSNIYYGQDWYGNYIKPRLLQYVAKWKAQKHLSVSI